MSDIDSSAIDLLSWGLDEYGWHTEAENARNGIDLDEYKPELWSIKAALSQSDRRIAELQAQVDAMKAAIFGGDNYASELQIGNFVEMARAAESGRLGAIERAEKAEAALDECRDDAERYRSALRSIAGGNIGDGPGQANYARIRQSAIDAARAK